MKINIKNTNLYFQLDTIVIQPKDTILITVNPYDMDLHTARAIADGVKEVFPNNPIIIKHKDVEITTN